MVAAGHMPSIKKSPSEASLPASSNGPNSAPAQSFESALGELEAIVATMETGQMPLQQALESYKRGVALLHECQETLSAAEQQISILDAAGVRKFDPESNANQHD